MFKLERSLHEWVALGLISAEQAARIRQHEAAKPESSWILSSFLFLGVAIAGIGVISLIAANWELLPDGAKLGGDFALLALSALAAFQAWARGKWLLFEVILLAFFLLCLASIGLISQIYHSGGQLYQALLLWSLITCPAVFAARRSLVPHVWSLALIGSLAFAFMSVSLMQRLFADYPPALVMFMPLLAFNLGSFCKLTAKQSSLGIAFQRWAWLGSLVSLVVLEVVGDSLNTVMGVSAWRAFAPAYTLAALCLAMVWLSPMYRRSQKVLAVLILANFVLSFHLPLLERDSSFLYAANTIVFYTLVALLQASVKNQKLFQCMLFLVAARFLLVYFQALGGLLATGLGLIFSGFLVIALVLAWSKYRKRLGAWAEGWMQ